LSGADLKEGDWSRERSHRDIGFFDTQNDNIERKNGFLWKENN
jgi:hypothetical protein